MKQQNRQPHRVGRVLSLVLTTAELQELTDYNRPSKQAEVLADMGIPYRVTPKGSIKVIRDDVVSSPKTGRRRGPNLESI